MIKLAYGSIGSWYIKGTLGIYSSKFMIDGVMSRIVLGQSEQMLLVAFLDRTSNTLEIPDYKAWCLTKPGGRMLLGVPVAFDHLLFNANRLYGPLQLSHVFANWNQIYTEAKFFSKGADTPKSEWPSRTIYGYQPPFILEKPATARIIDELWKLIAESL